MGPRLWNIIKDGFGAFEFKKIRACLKLAKKIVIDFKMPKWYYFSTMRDEKTLHNIHNGKKDSDVRFNFTLLSNLILPFSLLRADFLLSESLG